MIKGLPAGHFMRVLQAIQDSKVEFYLTGSRFFGNATNASDYDFFCQDTDEARQFLDVLRQDGFQIEKISIENRYLDLITTDCYRVIQRPGIDISMVMSTRIKAIAREILLKTKVVLPRHAAHDQWELALIAACGSMSRQVLNRELFPYTLTHSQKVNELMGLLRATMYEEDKYGT